MRFIKRRLKQLKRECTRLEINVLQAENAMGPGNSRRGRYEEQTQDRVLEVEQMIMQSMLVNKMLLNKLEDMRSEGHNTTRFDPRRQSTAQRRSKTVSNVAASSLRRRRRQANVRPRKATNWAYSQRDVQDDDRSQMWNSRTITKQSFGNLATRATSTGSVSSRQRKGQRRPKKVYSSAANESPSIYSQSRTARDGNRDRDRMRTSSTLTEEGLASLATRPSTAGSVSSRQRKTQRKPKKVLSELGYLSVRDCSFSECSGKLT